MRGEWRSAAADLGGHSHVAAPARQGESAKPFEALTAQQRRSVQHGPRPRHWPGMALAQHGTGHDPRPRLPADLGSRSRSGQPHAARHPARHSIAQACISRGAASDAQPCARYVPSAPLCNGGGAAQRAAGAQAIADGPPERS
jgi:hypothetical protein